MHGGMHYGLSYMVGCRLEDHGLRLARAKRRETLPEKWLTPKEY
jgi:hypothetical protein